MGAPPQTAAALRRATLRSVCIALRLRLVRRRRAASFHSAAPPLSGLARKQNHKETLMNNLQIVFSACLVVLFSSYDGVVAGTRHFSFTLL
jgi:hypothetical protein